MDDLHNSMSELATQLLEKTSKTDVEDKSIIGLLSMFFLLRMLNDH